MRIESNFYAPEEKIYYIEFEEGSSRKELKLKVEKLDYKDEEESIYIVSEKSFNELFKFLNSNNKAFYSTECEEVNLIYNYEEENFVYSIEYDINSLKPVRISIYIKDVNYSLHFIV